MTPYFIAFCISILSTFLAQKKKKGFIFYLYSILAVAPLVVVAAYRDPEIGTDTINYINLFNSAVDHNGDFDEYIDTHTSFEFVFLLYNYIISLITTDIVVYYFITYSIIVGATYSCAIRLKQYINPTIFMLVYVLLFYSESLNIMRQYIAISFVLVATTNLIYGRNRRYIIWSVLAYLFHTSAIISFVIGAIYFICKRYPFKQNLYKYLVIAIVMIVGSLAIEYLPSLGWLKMVEAKLSQYIDTEISEMSNSHIAICICSLLYLIVTNRNNAFNSMTLLVVFFTLILYLSPIMNATLYRATIYFSSMLCFAVAYTLKNSTNTMLKTATIALLVFYASFYAFSIVINGSQQVVPYTSTALGI